MKIDLEHRGRRRSALVRRDGETVHVSLDDGEPHALRVVARHGDTLLIEIDGRRRRLRWARRGREIHLAARGRSAHFHWLDDDEVQETTVEGSPVVRAPMPGKVLEVTVAAGDEVEAGRVTVRIEAMKMELALETPVAGRVETVHVAEGDLVEPDQPLVTVDPEASD